MEGRRGEEGVCSYKRSLSEEDCATLVSHSALEESFPLLPLLGASLYLCIAFLTRIRTG